MASHLIDYRTHGKEIAAPDGTCLFSPGDDTSAFLIVLEGKVRVEQTNASGRTVVLYRVKAGDSCVLTTSCLLSSKPYPGYGYAEGAVRAISIPLARFKTLLGADAGFQEVVFRGFANRVGELSEVIDDLLEHRTDLRLARWLAKKGATDITMTQQDIAQELGTAREVVSRALKAFERHGWITIGRGTLTVLSPAELSAHGSNPDV